jgi:hypothetical protein
MHGHPDLKPTRAWRLRAEEYRVVAHQLKNEIVQASMLRMAETYDRLAERYERQTTGTEGPKKWEAG